MQLRLQWMQLATLTLYTSILLLPQLVLSSRRNRNASSAHALLSKSSWSSEDLATATTSATQTATKTTTKTTTASRAAAAAAAAITTTTGVVRTNQTTARIDSSSSASAATATDRERASMSASTSASAMGTATDAIDDACPSTTQTTTTNCNCNCNYNCIYDVYIVVNPSGNTIGQATADELARRLSSSSSSASRGSDNLGDFPTPGEDADTNHHHHHHQSEANNADADMNAKASPDTKATRTNTKSVVCLVCCPPCNTNPEPVAVPVQSEPMTTTSATNADAAAHSGGGADADDAADGGGGAAILEPRGDSVWFLSDTTNLVFDPFGNGPTIRASAENCLDRIVASLCKHETETDDLGAHNDGVAVAATVRSNIRMRMRMRIRGIVLNPYGCCPEQEESRSLRSSDRKSSSANHARTRMRTQTTSPLAEYKLLSNAVFVHAAMARRSTVVSLPLPGYVAGEGDREFEFDHEREREREHEHEHEHESIAHEHEPGNGDECDNTPLPPSLRVVVVGTEAARGLPRMGIPVPGLEEDDEHENEYEYESTIRNRLWAATNTNTASWESEYAEMSAVAVLYFKALAASLDASRSASRNSSAKSNAKSNSNSNSNNAYIAIVSPGMTQESLKLEHVPVSGRTLSFRCKLWLCRLPKVFAWLRTMEIAKTSQEGGALLASALLNDVVVVGEKEGVTDANADASSDAGGQHKQDGETSLPRWDDVYPSGSFVGAKSGTGGPLCEQALLVYNATSGRVGLVDDGGGDGDGARGGTALGHQKFAAADDNNKGEGGTNFLGNQRLQHALSGCRIHNCAASILPRHSLHHNWTVPHQSGLLGGCVSVQP
eukprot:jgi/Psemu1/54018/gm1.54018_g